MEFLKRRRRLVKGGLQVAAIAYVFFIMLAILAFHTWLSYTRIATKLPEKDRPPLVEFYVQDVIITICFMGLFVLFMGLVGSHRFAGPVYRFEQVLKKLQKGDLSEVLHLRKGDLLQDFCEELNLALANLRELVAEDRVHVAEAIARLQELRASSTDPEQARRVDHLVSVLRRVTTKFVLSPPALRHEEQAALQARGLAAAHAHLAASGPHPAASGPHAAQKAASGPHAALVPHAPHLPDARHLPPAAPSPAPVPGPRPPPATGPVAPLPPPAYRPAGAPSGPHAPYPYVPATHAAAPYGGAPAGAGYPGAPPAASGTGWPKVHGGIPIASSSRAVPARTSGAVAAAGHALAQPIPPGLYPTAAAPPPAPAATEGGGPADGTRR